MGCPARTVFFVTQCFGTGATVLAEEKCEARAGKYASQVRGIDRSGKVQESGSLVGRVTGSFPSGSKGIHEVDVTVQ